MVARVTVAQVDAAIAARGASAPAEGGAAMPPELAAILTEAHEVQGTVDPAQAAQLQAQQLAGAADGVRAAARDAVQLLAKVALPLVRAFVGPRWADAYTPEARADIADAFAEVAVKRQWTRERLQTRWGPELALGIAVVAPIAPLLAERFSEPAAVAPPEPAAAPAAAPPAPAAPPPAAALPPLDVAPMTWRDEDREVNSGALGPVT